MTASNTHRDESKPSPGGRPQGQPPRDAHLDSTAHLMNRISSQLGSQLSLVSYRRAARRPARALVLVAHGSRDPRTLATVHALVDTVRELRPGLPVHLGHIELNEPLLPETLAGLGDQEAVLVPLLLSRGYHVKQDIPEMAAASRVRARFAEPLGPHPLLVDALYERLAEAGWHTPATEAERRSSGVVLAAAGSRDPDAAVDTGRTAQLLAERLGVPVLPAYASAAAPTVPEAVRALAARGRHRVAVASYFTAPGRFATECAAAAPWIAAAPLGAHPALARLVLHRYDEAATAKAPASRPALATA
ncbi:sirohydrochlorin chelatase [Streptomyces phyllanthi]|uniref:Sirohydrochlorin chelatase n=1 Tax=Streptomyces phyllanthi TaxID=1803180 RepID=A0A5N8WFD1_9ACTN|nr:sirohydrochlorin chelatase [Streptomyces phyllanthi]MPY45977.1 sirohydrochlorin chelatase [Streptomyces phyllanthi]